MSARAWVAFAAVSTLWGMPYLFIKIAVDDGVPPAFLAWVRVVLGAVVLLGLAWRAGVLRSLSGRWFQPMLKIVPPDGEGGHVQLLEMTCACGQGSDALQPGLRRRPTVYTASFEAPISGDVFLYVNELAALVDRPTQMYSDNNQGKAEVRIDRVD